MSDTHEADPRPATPAPIHADAHDDAREPNDGHGLASEALGPLNWGGWGAGILGVAIGIVIALTFLLATA